MTRVLAVASEVFPLVKTGGLADVVGALPAAVKGHGIDKAGETAVDVVAYGAHIAALLGAHIVKVKPPTDHIAVDAAKKALEKANVPLATLADRIRHVVRSTFDGRRIVIFSGGEAKETPKILDEIKAIHAGGGFGSIVGRNSFQRPRAEGLALLKQIMDVYAG